MALLLPNSVFVHIPKTAGQWVAQAIINAGIDAREIGVVHASPDELVQSDAGVRRRIVFSFVRHPLTWYPSMWAHRMDDGWNEPIDDPQWFTPKWIEFWADFTARCRSETFAGFVRACTGAYPSGFVAMLYEAYTAGCSYVGRYERLADDLVGILRAAGEDFDAARLVATPPQNVRGGNRVRRGEASYDEDLAARVLETERNVLDRFAYTADPRAGMARDLSINGG
jgi:hypothetical protein